MEMFRIQCKMRKKELYWAAGGILAAYFLGLGIWSAVCAGDDEAIRAVPFGTVIAVFSTVIANLIGGTINLVNHFDICISMGATRKQFVRSYAVFGLLELLAAFGFVTGLYGLERVFDLKVLGLPAVELPWVSAWRYLAFAIVASVGILAIELFCGALILKFGVKAVAGLWFAIMAVCYLPGILDRGGYFADFLEEMQSGGINSLTASGMVAGAAFVYAVLLSAAWGMLRRQQVS